jgi:predicted component of type VI protein secretion system
MKYNEFINESKQNNIVNIILDSLEPTIVEMLAATEKWFVETFKQEFTKYDRESARLNLIYDMVKSIEIYTMPSDSLISLNVRKSAKGNIEISSQIQRDGITYNFNTEAIYAGGHNIQRLHYRYIVKTTIPKTGVSEITKEYTEKIKKMSKLEKLNKEINSYEQRIKTAEEKVEVNSKVTDAEILKILKSKEDWRESPTWEEIIKRDAAKNYNNDEAHYYKEQERYLNSRIDHWKYLNVNSNKSWLIGATKELKKLQAKRDSMV